MKNKLIGLVGFARAGKNSFADFLINNRQGYKDISFAYALRKELDSFLLNRLNISAFTEDPEEKEIIRPLLVCWGTQVMRQKIDRDYWVKSVEKTVEINRKNNICSIITDVRFENEIKWISNNGGICIWIEREGVKAKNADEHLHTEPLQKECDFYFKWHNLENFKSEGLILVKEFLINNNICQPIQPTKN
tara:strand:+ start:85 stop:657 length:573 start_codon:yes stop_codon:yes gene_type:complete